MSQEINDLSVRDFVPELNSKAASTQIQTTRVSEQGTVQMLKKRDQGIKIRLKFAKYGAMKFIGHLDIMRFFQKLIRRAKLEIAYSEGFHPHQIMSFANPLGVGLISNGEYVDITLTKEYTSKEIVDSLNAVSVEGIKILSARRLPVDAGNGMASVSMADYSLEFTDSSVTDGMDLETLWKDFYNRPEILVEKKTKKGSKMIDLKQSIHELKVCDKSGKQGIFMKVNAGSAENIRPELVLNAIFEYAGKVLPEFSYIITREEQYEAMDKTLEDMGVEI